MNMNNQTNPSANEELGFVSNLSDTEIEAIQSGKVKKIIQVPYRQELVKELQEKDAPFKHLSKVFRLYHLMYGMGITRPAASSDEIFQVIYPEYTVIDSSGRRVAQEGKKEKLVRLIHDVNNWFHNPDATFYRVEDKDKANSTDEVIAVNHVIARIIGDLKKQPMSRLRKIYEGCLKAEVRIEERSYVSVEHIKKQEVKFVKHAEIEIEAAALNNEAVRLKQQLAVISKRKADVNKKRDDLWREDDDPDNNDGSESSAP